MSSHVTLSAFLNALFEHGRVRVSRPEAELSPEEAAAADRVLAECELAVRAEFPGQAPEFDLAAARWAATVFQRACQLTAYRDQEIGDPSRFTQLEATSFRGAKGDEQEAAGRHYSVDMVFRFLPDLHRLARGVSQGDPLLDRIRQWALDWPLSSVGMKDVQPGHVDELVEHAGLLRYYADRVIARRDLARLDHPRVQAAVRQALGMYDQLAPDLAAALRTPNQQGVAR